MTQEQNDVHAEQPRLVESDVNDTRRADRRSPRFLAASILALGVACGGSGPASEPVTPSTPSASVSPSSESEELAGYIGPAVSFQVPEGWEVFYLEVPFKIFAAYGPIEGGDADYVAVAPVPPGVDGSDPEKILRSIVGPGASPEVNELDGMTAYGVSMTGDDLTQRTTIVEGQKDLYLVTCQYSESAATQVAAGCEDILASLREVDPSPVTDPSGCTDRELALIESVPVLEGAQPKPTATDLGKMCDMQFELSAGFDGDPLAILGTALDDAGWNVSGSKMARISAPHEVWRLLADRDYDRLAVEAFIRDGVTDRYFVTAWDG